MKSLRSSLYFMSVLLKLLKKGWQPWENQSQNWYRKFHSDSVDIKDVIHSIRPAQVNEDKIKPLVEANCQIMTKYNGPKWWICN